MKNAVDKNLLSRRSFLKYGILTIGGIASASFVVPLVRYFISPALKKQQRNWMTVASVKNIPIGTPIHVQYEERVQDSWRETVLSKAVWVVTKDGKNFTVFDPHCTHLGCLYAWNEAKKRFLCPCHAGVFDIDGNVISGPPPRPLDRLANKLDGDKLVVQEIA